MNILFKWWHYICLSGLLYALTFFSSGIIQLLSAILLIFTLALAYGYIINNENKLWPLILYGFLTVLAINTIIGSALIFFYKLNFLTISLSWLLILVWPTLKFYKNPQKINFILPTKKINIDVKNMLLLVIFFSFIFLIWQWLLSAISDGVIYDTWSTLPKIFFTIIFFTILTAIIYSQTSKNNSFLFITSLVFFTVLSIAALIYKIGYGFDPFIHLATVKIVLQTGTVNPKPLYYLGQYSLITNFHYLFDISVEFLNKWLVPIFYSLFVPSIIYYSFVNNFKSDNKLFRILPLASLIIPFASFIYTTPQGLANSIVLLLMFISLSVLISNRKSHYLIWLLALFALSIHPIAGVPAVFLAAFISFEYWSLKFGSFLKKAIFWEIFILALLALPALFVLNSVLNGNKISIIINNFSVISNWLTNNWQYINYVSINDFIYLISNNINILILILAIFGYLYICREKKFKYFANYLFIYLILIFDYLFLKYWVKFDFLINYEQSNYTTRLLELAWLALLPIVLIALYQLLVSVNNNVWQKKFTFIILIALICVSIYTSYPRRDQYVFNKFINTTQNDIDSVDYIAGDTKDYIVLANQSVSAAALYRAGFAKYYNQNFYYPLPTSGVLYQSYLDLAYQNKSIEDVLTDVFKLTNVNNIYFVINSYWSGFEDIIDYHAKKANNSKVIGNGQIYIFNYQYDNSSAR